MTNAFAKAIHLAREDRGVSIRTAGDRIGISATNLAMVERGVLPDVLHFRALCKWAQLDPQWALDALDRPAR